MKEEHEKIKERAYNKGVFSFENARGCRLIFHNIVGQEEFLIIEISLFNPSSLISHMSVVTILLLIINFTIGLLFLLNKIPLVLLLLNLMFVFKGSKHKKITFIWTLFSTFSTLSHVTCVIGFIWFWSHSVGMLN